MQIITNNKPRLLLYGYELTDKQKQEFDYIAQDNIDSHNFIKYKGFIYDVSEFISTYNIDSLKDWDGYTSDSYFSGVLIKIVDSDTVIMGSYLS